MTQLDRIEAKLDRLLEAQSTSALSTAMTAAVEQTLAIKEAQRKALAPVEPEHELPAGAGAIQPYREHASSDPRDMTGDIPAVKAGKADPASPRHWAGVPQWEKGREPRIMRTLKRLANK